MGVDHGQHHVAVVQLAEQALQVTGAAPGRLSRLAEAEAGRLEDVAQALGGDPHVVLRDGVGGVERGGNERAHLFEAHGDDARRVLLERRGRVEPLHAPRLHAALPAGLGQPHDLERRRGLVLHRRRLGTCDELGELIAERGELVLGDEARERRVCLRLLGAQPRDQRLDAGAVGRRHRLRDLLERGDRHVAVAPLPERVGELLHLAQPGLQLAPRKAWPEDLERRPQPPRGDAHVVHALDVVHVEHAAVRGRSARRREPRRPSPPRSP